MLWFSRVHAWWTTAHCGANTAAVAALTGLSLGKFSKCMQTAVYCIVIVVQKGIISVVYCVCKMVAFHRTCFFNDILVVSHDDKNIKKISIEIKRM